MKMLFLIWSGLWSRPTRTVFTLASLAVGFLLFGLLQGVNSAFTAAGKRTQLDRLIVGARFDALMPKSDLNQIAQVPGVKEAIATQNLPGYFRDPRNGMLIIATEPAAFFRMRNEYVVDPQQLQALLGLRTGMIVERGFAQKMGWKIGDKIPLGSISPRADGATWTFDIVGFTANPNNPGAVPFAIANYDYVNESRAFLKDRATRFTVRVVDPRHSLQVAEAIDALFASSAAPSRTQAENELAQSDLATIGDVRRLTGAIMAAVFFATLFLTGNVIRQSTRERVWQFGTLKTLGFSDAQVMLVVAAEALLLCLLGALVGLALAALLFPFVASYLPTLSGYLGTPHLSVVVLILGIGSAVALTVASAAQPAWTALRLSVADALRVRA